MNEINYKPIGVIRTPFNKPKGTPIQPFGGKGIKGTVEVFPKFAKGLKDIEGFSHIILIYHFHLSKKSALIFKPFLHHKTHGVFACRAPSRPNQIGISTVRLVNIKKNILYIQDVDIVDGTPLLDIKPYVPQFDLRKVGKIGWLEKEVNKVSFSRDDGRFAK